jgi:4-amino-4-deoxy-L-arabinose transferase-like glycosyltransferase
VLLVDELRDAWSSESRSHRLALAVIVVIGVALRLLYVGQPMRNEEAVAYLDFVRRPWPAAVSGYASAGNHLLYTVLAKAAAGVFGPAPWSMRLPALIAGILVIPATYAAARAFYGSRAALIAAALVASSGALVLYSTNARGFAIVVLCFLLLVLLGIRLLSSQSPGVWVSFGVIALLGLATMPGMMFPLGSVALWLALSVLTTEDKGLRGRVFFLVGAILALTVLVYAPLLARDGGAGLQSMASRNNDWLAFFVELSLSMGSVGLSWALGLPPIVAMVVLVLALIALQRHRKVSRFPIGLPLAAFVFCCWLLVVVHRAPVPRVWLWLLPLVLTLAAVGMVDVLEQQSHARRVVTEHVGIAAMIVVFVATSFVTLSSAVLMTRETGAYRDAERAVDALKPMLQQGDLVVTGQAGGVLEYYLDRKGVDRSHLAVLPSRARRVFVIVDGASGEMLDRVPVPREVHDTTRFTPPSVAGTLPSSRIFLFRRRSAAGP